MSMDIIICWSYYIFLFASPQELGSSAQCSRKLLRLANQSRNVLFVPYGLTDHFLSLHLPVVDTVFLLGIQDFRTVSYLKQLVFIRVNKVNWDSPESSVGQQLCAKCHALFGHDR